jgi:hypothetical protein
VLRRAENVSVGFVRRPLTRWGFVTATIGRDVHRIGWGSRDEYERASAVSLQQPQFVIAHRGRTYWQYRGRFWWDDAGLTAFQVHALITSREDRQRAQVERAEEIFSMGGLAQDRPRQRRQIPDDVKHLVWLRDRGQCQNGVAVRPRHTVRDGRCGERRESAAAVRAVQSPKRSAGLGRMTLPSNYVHDADAPAYPIGPRRRNGLGALGFALGLVALAFSTRLVDGLVFSCLSLGLSIPALNLHRRPRGWAVAAIVVSTLAAVAAIGSALIR